MPELPEVETVRRTLLPALRAKIVGVRSSGKTLHMRRPVRIDEIRDAVIGKRITGLRRIGKYLLVDVGKLVSVLVHLGMSGRFRLVSAREPEAPHTHVVLELAAGRELRFTDPRRFGQFALVQRGAEHDHPALAGMGPDALEDEITGAYLYDQARRRKVPLKSFLLDQKVLAGVGNIYASEALWRAKLRPARPSHLLDVTAAKLLASAVRRVIADSLTKGGTSLKDFVDANGNEGENADYLKVYGREGEPCPRCRTRIRRTVIQGRATYACPTCQSR
jgi:formamidopyrimidine-DNA glycosylase